MIPNFIKILFAEIFFTHFWNATALGKNFCALCINLS